MVLTHTGATLPRRDPLDARIVEETRTGTARFGGSYDARFDDTGDGKDKGKGIIDSQKTVGGWPELNSAPAPDDADQDGMPNAWERGAGLDPEDPSDGPQDMDGDGYTNLEEYLNGTGPTEFVDYSVQR